MRPSLYLSFLLLPVLIATGVPGVATQAPGGQTTPQAQGGLLVPQPEEGDQTDPQLQQNGREKPTLQPVDLGQLSPQAETRGQDSPRSKTRVQGGRKPTARVESGSRTETRVQSGPQKEIESGRPSLTRMDLTQLPRDNNTYSIPKPRYPQLGCKTLSSKMQISDGFCTSVEPVKSVICEGNCLPQQDLPWFAQFMKIWGKAKVIDYVCEDDVVRRRKVTLICENGETRKIRIKVVRSCKCTRLVEPANRPLSNKNHYVTNVGDVGDNQMDRDRINRKHRRRKHKKRRKDKRRRKDRNKGQRKKNRDRKRARGRTSPEL